MATELSLVALLHQFPDDATAEVWFIAQRWPAGVHCPACHAAPIQARPTRPPQPFRCRPCRKDFSVRTNPLLPGSTLSLETWALAYYLLATHPQGISSLQLSKLLGVTQKTAWYLAPPDS